MNKTNSSASIFDCYQHEQEISILQQKLMECHNKLLDQLDVCKQQELTIIKLNKLIIELENDKEANAFDAFQYQSFGQPRLEKENDYFGGNINHQSNTKYTLLEADLQAMRNKVLSEITQKNKIKEQIKELKSSHKKQIYQQNKKIESFEKMIKQLQKQYEQMRQKYEKTKRDRQKSKNQQNQLDKLTNRYVDLESKFYKQRETNRELLEQRRKIQEKLERQKQKVYQLQEQIQKKSRQSAMRQKNLNLISESNITATQQQRQIELLKNQIGKLNKNVQLRDYEFKQSRDDRKSKHNHYEQTKVLIKKLEQAESNARKNKRSI